MFVSVLVLAAALSPWPQTFVSVGEVPLDLAGVTVLDARDDGPFKRGHIPHAQRADWTKFREGLFIGGRLPDDLSQVAHGLERLGVDDKKRVLVCGAALKGWGEEGRIAWLVMYLGHPAVAVLDGGCQAWTAAGRSFTTVRDDVTHHHFTAKPDERLRARAGDLVQAMGGKSQVLDVRTTEEFNGKTSYFEARGGHIPGAVHVDHSAVFGVDGRVKSAAALRQLLISAGIDPEKPVIAYCTGGVRSAFVVMALRSAGVDARNYDGSFWEWASDDKLPVVR